MRCSTGRGPPRRVAARRPMPAVPKGAVGRAAAAPRPAPADRKDPAPGRTAPGRAAPARPTPARTTTARPRATTTGRARTAEPALALRDRLARPRQTLDQIRRPDGSGVAPQPGREA